MVWSRRNASYAGVPNGGGSITRAGRGAGIKRRLGNSFLGGDVNCGRIEAKGFSALDGLDLYSSTVETIGFIVHVIINHSTIKHPPKSKATFQN